MAETEAALAAGGSPWQRLLPPMPKEHGTWAWVLVPALTGLLAIDGPSLPARLLFVGAVLGFFLRAAMEGWRASRPRQIRYLGWAAVFGIAVHATAVPPLAHWDRTLLLPLSAGIAVGPLAVVLIRPLRVRRRVLGEVAIIASLSLLAPAVAYAGSGEIDRLTGFLWLPGALYLWGSVTYVRLSLAPAAARSIHLRRERRRVAGLYHAALPVALAGVVAGGAMPALAALAFVPMLAKAAHSVWRNTQVASVQELGIWEIVHATTFVALLITLYRVATLA